MGELILVKNGQPKQTMCHFLKYPVRHKELFHDLVFDLHQAWILLTHKNITECQWSSLEGRTNFSCVDHSSQLHWPNLQTPLIWSPALGGPSSPPCRMGPLAQDLLKTYEPGWEVEANYYPVTYPPETRGAVRCSDTKSDSSSTDEQFIESSVDTRRWTYPGLRGEFPAPLLSAGDSHLTWAAFDLGLTSVFLRLQP